MSSVAAMLAHTILQGYNYRLSGTVCVCVERGGQVCVERGGQVYVLSVRRTLFLSIEWVWEASPLACEQSEILLNELCYWCNH